jgi:hypothetical protein
MLLLAALAGSAHARAPIWSFAREDNQQPLEWHCNDDQVRVVQGTVPWATAVEARRSNARTYSALAELENGLLPALENRDEGAVWRLGWNTMYHVTTLPSTACGELASQVYDVGSYNMSIGGGNEHVQIFYSAAATYALVTQHWVDRTLKHGGGFMIGHFYSLTAPLWGSRVINADDIGGDSITESWSFLSSGDGAIGGVSLDYVAGVRGKTKYLEGGLGYLGSKGVFGNVAQPQTGLFIDSVSDVSALTDTTSADLLRYLKTGASGFHWEKLLRASALENFGATDAIFSRYQQVRPSGQVQQSNDVNKSADINQDRLTLTQLQQRNIYQYVDVSARYQLKPEPQLYELGVRVHTEGYHTDLADRWRGSATIPSSALASVAVGVINLPARTWYGVNGGVRPYISADVRAFMDDGDASSSNVSFSMKYNDPDTLIIFPFADNAVEMHIVGEIAL